MNRSTAWVAQVTGFSPGLGRSGTWYAVFDDRGHVVVGTPGETLAAVRIRYLDTDGKPFQWRTVNETIPVSEFAKLVHSVRAAARPNDRGDKPPHGRRLVFSLIGRK